MESRIFSGQRALGYICNHIPVQIRYIKKHQDTFIITVVGKRFHTFSASKLHLYSTSEFHPSDITCLAVDQQHVITACREDIRVFRRGVEPDAIHPVPNVRHLLLFGTLICAVADNKLIVIVRDSGEGYLDVPFPQETFEITCLTHPATYVNKILLGSRQGGLQLWNINSAQKIYEFASFDSAIICLEQSPAVDVYALGLESGTIIIHNLKSDEILMRFQQDWGSVTSLTFRTDGPPIIISGSKLGHLAVWNLDSKRLVAQKENCHQNQISGLKAFPSQPLLVTSSPDNSLRLWMVDDESSVTPRLHAFREGHTAPPNKIRFYGEAGSMLLSGGGDAALRAFSLEAEFLSFSLGRGSSQPKLAKKRKNLRQELQLPEIVDFYAETVREAEWDNIVAVHRSSRQVTTWSYHRKTMGQHFLLHERFAKKFDVQPTCVGITACGNFCVIGYSTGHVDRFNIQSGIFRHSYGTPQAHSGPVVGVASDSLIQQVFTAGENQIKFWNFKSGKLNEMLKTDAKIGLFLAHPDNSLAAVALKDSTILIVDLDIRRIIRTFAGHQKPVTDMAFSLDSRWLVSASLDCSIRVWDLSSASLIDSFRVATHCTSLTFSPTGEFLATTHRNELGIFLWTNKTIFRPTTLTRIPFDSEPQLLTLPGTGAVNDEIFPDEEVMDEVYESPEQLADKFLTLSLLPDYRWKNLARQDLIRERNKPKEALKMPEKVPFFLPTIPGLEPKFDTAALEKRRTNTEKMIFLGGNAELLKIIEEKNAGRLLGLLKKFTPSQTEAEMRKLAPLNGGNMVVMKGFVECLVGMVESGKEQELCQAYVELFLKLHLSSIGDEVDKVELEDWIGLLGRLKDVGRGHVRRVEELLDQSLDVVMFLKHVGL